MRHDITIISIPSVWRILPAALAIALLTGCASLPVSSSEPVGGASVTYATVGEGSPTVVMEAGLGDSRATWNDLAMRLSGASRVFTYDRPGYSPSFKNKFDSDRDGRRTGEEVATHLRALLDRADVEPPYLLVGHSIGGLYVLAFAKLYPEDVEGIVLVDGRPADFTAACESADAGPCKPPGMMVALMPTHQKAEVKGIPETESFAPAPWELGRIPVTVIAATEPPIGGNRTLQKLWLRHQEKFADHAPRGRYVQANGAGHYIHRDMPGLVYDEIVRMLDDIRSRSGRVAARTTGDALGR